MDKLTRISTVGMSREEWLERRRHTIGGSDAAGIVGLSRYATPYTVFLDKTGRLPDKPDNEAMRQGRDLEDYVAKRWEEATGKKVRRLQAMLYNPAYPFAHADVDRMVVGEDAGLECKTTATLDIRQFNGVDFPEKYYAQCVHYMAVTGAKRWYLGVLVFGRGFFVFTLEWNQAEIDALMVAEAAFWEKVENDTPPAPDGSDAATDAISVVYAESSNGEMELFGREAMLNEYTDLKAQKKAVDERIKEIENTIKDDMQEIPLGRVGRFSVVWKSQQRSVFQLEEFKKDHPGLDLRPYIKTTTSRPFKVTENKED